MEARPGAAAPEAGNGGTDGAAAGLGRAPPACLGAARRLRACGAAGPLPALPPSVSFSPPPLLSPLPGLSAGPQPAAAAPGGRETPPRRSRLSRAAPQRPPPRAASRGRSAPGCRRRPWGCGARGCGENADLDRRSGRGDGRGGEPTRCWAAPVILVGSSNPHLDSTLL